MRRSVLLLMAVVLVCGGMIPAAVSAQEPYNMSLLIGALDNPYWITLATAAEKAAADLGVNLTVLGTSEEGAAAQQISQMEDRIAAGDDLILIAARSSRLLQRPPRLGFRSSPLTVPPQAANGRPPSRQTTLRVATWVASG